MLCLDKIYVSVNACSFISIKYVFLSGLTFMYISSLLPDALSKSDHVINGELSCQSQYHFHMETQVCLLHVGVTASNQFITLF